MNLRVGVVGTGMIGQDHIRRLSSLVTGATVVAVSDVDRALAAQVASQVGARHYESGEELVASADVDAVVVASWGPTHEQFVLAAIAAGKPVFCEKPLAPTAAACLRMMDAEVAFGRRLVQVGFMRHYDRAYVAMKETIDSGAIGAPLLFHSVHRNPSVPSFYTSDMLITDTAVHDIDITRWLLSDEVAAVNVLKARPNSHGGGSDPILIILEMRGGALVDIEVSVNVGYGYDIRGEVSGETGAVQLVESNPVAVKTSGEIHGRVPGNWPERFAQAFDDEFRAWIAAASAGTATGPSVWDGYAATVVSDAGLLANATQSRAIVTMIDRPALYEQGRMEKS
jgi:myo-inositol 2-dehydrogenase / D-chiro-inositol 1-dehydrogenase